MAESKATAPDFVLTLEVDMEEAVELRKQLKVAAQDGRGTAPSFNDFVIKASALALRDFPRANGAYRDGKFELYSRVNVGVAVAGPGRARRADRLRRRPQVARADRRRGARARRARARRQDHPARALAAARSRSPTSACTGSELRRGDQPAAGGDPRRRRADAAAVVRDGEVVRCARMKLTLACDHRILYGADAAQFLARIREQLEEPLLLAL